MHRMGERERRERKRERRREYLAGSYYDIIRPFFQRARERETEYYVAFRQRIADEDAKIRQKNLPDNFHVC